MAADMSEGLTRVKPTAGQNMLRTTAAAATLVAPTAVLGGAEQLFWHTNSLLMWGYPANWSSGHVVIDSVGSMVAGVGGYYAAKAVNRAIRERQTRPASLQER